MLRLLRHIFADHRAPRPEGIVSSEHEAIRYQKELKDTYIHFGEASSEYSTGDIWAVQDNGWTISRGRTADVKGLAGCVDGLVVEGTSPEGCLDSESAGSGGS